MWVVVKIRVPFGVLNIIRHLLFRVPKKDPNSLAWCCKASSVGFAKRRGFQDLRLRVSGWALHFSSGFKFYRVFRSRL